MKILGLILCLCLIFTFWTVLTGAGWTGIKGQRIWHGRVGVLQPVMQQGDGLIVLPLSDLGNPDLSKRVIGSKEFSCYVTEGTPLPQEWARGGHVAGIVEGNVIVAGGNNWSKDKTTKYWLKNSAVFRDSKWIPGPVFPKPLAYAMYSHDNKGLYVAGGTEDGGSVSREVYCLNSLKEGEGWESLTQLPEGISYGAGAILNGKFYVACGSLGTEKTNRMWVLDINTAGNNWHECQSVPGVERMFPSLVACGKYLYLLGGLAETSPLTPLKDIYRYDPDKNKWKNLKDLPLMGYAWVSQPVDDNHLIITGRADGNVNNGIWIIDLRDMSMKEIGNLIIPSTTAPLINIADKQWWLIGGEPDANKNRTGKVSVIYLK